MIETERLLIKPLTYDNLIKYLKNDNSLEVELCLNPSSRTISSELKDALENTILPNVANTNKNYLFTTLWTIVLKSENIMVGDICIVDEPNQQGEIEIGYGTYEKFQSKGYMTEAVNGIIEWAKTQPNVKSIIASTSNENAASYKVLIKNNFEKIGESEGLINWKLLIK
ncbi:MAG TPA: N-acetyltransferase [Bacteroidales bacterium]|nr:N-acetyltransferase [Bacteroidales bacterium]